MRAFRRSVTAHFAEAAVAVGSRLKRLSSSLYGFTTEYAIVTIGVYHGHFPAVCVKLRQRAPADALVVDGDKDIGLANIVAFSDPSAPPETQPEHYWTADSLDSDLRRLAANLLRYGQPFLIDPKADWRALRTWLDKRVKEALAEMPWLEKYSQKT
jgi:hypothetical protein